MCRNFALCQAPRSLIILPEQPPPIFPPPLPPEVRKPISLSNNLPISLLEVGPSVIQVLFRCNGICLCAPERCRFIPQLLAIFL